MSNGLLQGRKALITGAGTGIGRALALTFAREGASVALVARSREAPEKTVSMIRDEGGSAIFVQGDITSRSSVENAVAQSVDAFGGLDIVVQVAAHGRSNVPIAVEDISLEDWDEQAAVSLRACLYLARAAHPALKASGRGRFIGISSAYGLAGDGSNPIYAALKGGLRGFAKSLAKEWGDDAITVNLFAPSSKSESTDDYFRMHPEAAQFVRDASPMRRMGEPLIDIAPAIVALAGEQFRFVTGQTIPIDGGMYTTL